MDDPKQVMKKFVEDFWNSRQLDVADSIISPNSMTYQLRSGSPLDAVPRGPHDITIDITQWTASFADLRFSVEQMLLKVIVVRCNRLWRERAEASGWESRKLQEDPDKDVHCPPNCAR